MDMFINQGNNPICQYPNLLGQKANISHIQECLAPDISLADKANKCAVCLLHHLVEEHYACQEEL